MAARPTSRTWPDRRGNTSMCPSFISGRAAPSDLWREPSDRWCQHVAMSLVRRSRTMIVVAATTGSGLWLTLVPNDDPGGNARSPMYWWLCVLAAFVLGAATASRDAALVGAAVAAPALVLALWTAPRGDNDGLWLLWFPILFAFLLALACVGLAAAWLARRRRAEVLRRRRPAGERG